MFVPRATFTRRSRTAEWGVDPARVGTLGFSADGELVGGAARIQPVKDSPPAFLLAAATIDRTSPRGSRRRICA